MRRIGLAFLCIALSGMVSTAFAQKSLGTKPANDPVTLYRTVGIKECGENYRYKSEHTSAVLLQGDDLARAIAFLKSHYGDIDAVLYTHGPEATSERPGQPALVALRREAGSYCVLGEAGSYSAEPFVSFEKKYRDQLK